MGSKRRFQSTEGDVEEEEEDVDPVDVVVSDNKVDDVVVDGVTVTMDDSPSMRSPL